MIRSTASKVMWVGRATVFLVGLAVILALVLGVATTAMGANGNPFLLGKGNLATALTKLTGNVNGSAMQVVNSNAGANDTALSLGVQSGEAPMRVNSATKVANLNADRVDNREASSFANATHQHSGEAITSGTVEADRIEDGPGSGLNADQLDGVDSTQFAQMLDSGMTTVDPSSIAAQSCSTVFTVDPGAGDISNGVVVVTPSASVANENLVFYTTKSTNPNFFRIRICNITTSAIDPPSATYYWMIFHQP